MSRRYKVMLPLTVHTEDASYKQGQVFERDDEWAAANEAANLASGLLELQPSRYKVVGDSSVFETAPGEEFEAAIPVEQEKLLAGVHIERLPEPEPKPKRKKKEA